MQEEGNNHEAETEVQGSVDQTAGEAQPAPAGEAPRKRFLERFSRGSIAVVAAIAGLAVGAGGTALVGHEGHDRHHGFGHDRGAFGMERGGWDDGDRGQGGPPPMMYRQGGPQGGLPGGQQGGAAPRAPQGVAPQSRQQAPTTPQQQTAPQGTNRNGDYVVPSAVGTGSSY